MQNFQGSFSLCKVFEGKLISLNKTIEPNKTIKQELLNSLRESDSVEDPGLDETDNETNNPLEALTIIHRYKEIIKTHFRDTEHFFENVGERKSTIYLKMGSQKFLKKYHALKKSTFSSIYSKNNFKVIKAVCKSIANLNFCFIIRFFYSASSFCFHYVSCFIARIFSVLWDFFSCWESFLLIVRNFFVVRTFLLVVKIIDNESNNPKIFYRRVALVDLSKFIVKQLGKSIFLCKWYWEKVF